MRDGDPPSFADRFGKRPAAPEAGRPRSFADQYIARNPDFIHKLSAKDINGNWGYYVLFVEPRREKAFFAAMESDGIIDLTHFGKLLASCPGRAASEELKRELKERFGI